MEEGIRLYRENGCDFILAVGGGSTLDACKAIAAGVKYDGPVTDLFVNESGVSDIAAAAPLATILTMAGTGSEMDMGAVITVGEDHKKKVVMHPLLNPRFSILDPEYTYTVPEYHSMAGVADILCHLMEQYFTPDANAKVQDRMNEGVMKVVLEDAPKILANPKDYDARANIMWASSMALAGFQFVLGKPMFPFPLHGMGHELSSMYDMTHGVTLALLTPSWMRHTMRTAPEHLPIFARVCPQCPRYTREGRCQSCGRRCQAVEGILCHHQDASEPSRCRRQRRRPGNHRRKSRGKRKSGHPDLHRQGRGPADHARRLLSYGLRKNFNWLTDRSTNRNG